LIKNDIYQFRLLSPTFRREIMIQYRDQIQTGKPIF